MCDHHCSKVVTVFRFLTFNTLNFLMGAWGATGKNDDDDEDKDKPEIENSRKSIRLYDFFPPCFFTIK